MKQINNSPIPKRIMQTGCVEYFCPASSNTIIKMNPLYKYEYYSDSLCIDFLKKNFSQDVLTAFNKLKPGAFKADLFRYCYLYINGGVYIDLDMIPIKPLDLILVDNAEFISCLEDRPNLRIDGIYQGFIACVKNLNFLRTAIDRIVYYTKINYLPKKLESNIGKNAWTSCLSITGPVLLYNSINFKERPSLGYTNLNNNSIFLYSFNGHIFDLNNKQIIKNGIPYIRSNHYYTLFLKQNIYN